MSLTIDLPHDTEDALRRRAEAEGVSVEKCVQELLQRELEQLVDPSPGDPNLGGVAAMILERMGRLPAEALEGLPEDGASQHDHYIYGLPKKAL